MTVTAVNDAVAAGARREAACETVGLDARTLERWRGGKDEDLRRGPTMPPGNKLSAEERQEVLAVMNSKDFRELSPNQIVPLLADQERYLASESTMHRVLREEGLLQHRGRSKTPVRHGPRSHVATGPNQVWSWDITYLKSPVRGEYFFLYMILDVWSRKCVGYVVHDVECNKLAAVLFEETCVRMGVDPRGIVLHADNGGPMKGSTMVATLERLGVLTSFSRPRVSNDNPFSEALFRTMKYRPNYPARPFVNVAAAARWVAAFVEWYNSVHLHSGIRFVTPNDRHDGRDVDILARRGRVYEAARAKHRERWAGKARNWVPVGQVVLNPIQQIPASNRQPHTKQTGLEPLAA